MNNVALPAKVIYDADHPEYWFYESHLRRWYVRQAVYEEMIERYPALKGPTDEARAFRCIVGYVAFAIFQPRIKGEDEIDLENAYGKLVLPYRTVAALVGQHPKAHGFAAKDWIERFSKAVFPLNPVDYWYSSGQARVIRPEIDPELVQRMLERAKNPTNGTHVWINTGTPVSVRTYRERFQNKVTPEEKWARLLKVVPSYHPARPLLEYLSKKSQKRLMMLVRENWPRTEAAIEALPESTPDECSTKNWARRLAISLYENWQIYYTISERSPRIFPVGESLLYLPRDIRKIALTGGVECDLRAAQLAVAAKVWELPITAELLRSKKSIWDELAAAAGLPVIECKAILKKTLYSVIFGMTQTNLRRKLEHGTDGLAGIGRKATNRVFRHPVMKELIAARKQKHDESKTKKCVCDAWGNTVYMGPGTPFRTVRSLWAYAIQSFELKVLLALLPILTKNSQIYLIAWQHDGVTLQFGNRSKSERERNQIRAAVNRTCGDLDISSELEMEPLV
jgi:hypothetical protein